MYELAAIEPIMTFTLAGSGLALSAGVFFLGPARMVVLWVNRAGFVMCCLLLGCSVALVAVRLAFPEFRTVTAAAVLVLTMSLAPTLWWVVMARLVADDVLDADVRSGFWVVLAVWLAAAFVFVLASIYAGLWAQ